MAIRRETMPALLCLLFVLIAVAVVSAQPLHIPLETAEQDKAFSELNHHIAGFFLLVIGISAFLGNSSRRLELFSRVWPVLFILPGFYLAIMSDPDVWPMGEQSWMQAFRDNPEAAQHKTYAALLLAIGILEFKRSRGKLGPFLARWSFPILAVFGAVLLFFHPHQSGTMGHSMPGMHQDGMMTESMLKIKREHFWFSVVGFSVVVFKFLADGNYWKRSFVRLLWPVCISLLGVLLISYSE